MLSSSNVFKLFLIDLFYPRSRCIYFSFADFIPHASFRTFFFPYYIRGFQNRFLSFLLSCTLFRCLPLLFAVFVSSFIRQSHKDVVFSTASSWNSVSSVYGERRDSSHISKNLQNGFRWVYIHNGLRSRARRGPFGRRHRVQ